MNSIIKGSIEEVEKLSSEEAEKVRFENLSKTLHQVWESSAFYKPFYKKHGFEPGDFKSLKDLEKIPFITREELGLHSSEMTCTPPSKWIEMCPTSGTSGRSIYFPMTANDLKFMAELCARGARGLGIDENDTVQIMFTSDNLLQPTKVMTYMFQFHLGSLALRVGPVGTERQIKIMRELKPTVLFGLSSYLLTLGRSLKEYGFDPRKELNLKLLISTGSTIYHDRWTPTALNREVSEIWGAPYYSILGSTELNTGLWECPARQGHHVHWDYYIPEIINPISKKPVKEGERGELVLTLTGREAMPLIRYRTGDVTSLETSPCPCGRKSPRITAIVGRNDQMLKIKGTAIFPLQIEEAALAVKGVTMQNTEVITDEMGREQVIITIDSDEKAIIERVSEKVKTETNVSPIIRTDSAENIKKIWFSEGRVKPRKFWDRRK